jgi:glycerophosphoryl diester phosphodiesterase
VKDYHANQVKLNIETKVEAGAPEQTAPREQFVRRVYEEIHASGIERQVTIQSFDWGALKLMHGYAPTWPLVALTNYDFLQVGKPGASPWLGGVDADTYGGDLIKSAKAAVPGLTAVSPNYGFPQNGKVGDPGFRFYPDKQMVNEAHENGLKVIPWTCDDPATIEALMDMGVDGIITNYPNHVRDIMAERGMRLPKAYPAP